MKKVLFGIILFTAWVACSSSEPAVIDQSEDTKTSEEVTAIDDSTTSLVVILSSSNPYNGRFQFDSTSTGWEGVLQTYQMVGDTMRVVRENPLQPKVDWDEFNDFLNYLQIFNLPDQKDIDGYADDPVGSRNNPLNVQLIFQSRRANGDTNEYVYSNPAIETKNYWQSANVITFVSYITTEFLITEPTLPQQ